jgi:hypothetical protein
MVDDTQLPKLFSRTTIKKRLSSLQFRPFDGGCRSDISASAGSQMNFSFHVPKGASMPKNRKHKRGAKAPVSGNQKGNDRKALTGVGVIVGVLLLALIGFGALAGRTGPAIGRAPAPPPPLPTPQYTETAPAKEYIYAGGKLLAVSEPVNAVPSDLAVWRLAGGSGTWYVLGDGGSTSTQTWGQTEDVPAPGDFDGDGKTDFCVFRPGTTPDTGQWFVLESGNSSMTTYNFGSMGDTPKPADFDGDGRTDLAVYRSSTQTWYVFKPASSSFTTQQFGSSGDTPVPSDYDGDGKADFAVWKNATATWSVLQSGSGVTANTQWGQTGDKPVPGDYDGDGKTDYAVWQADNSWYIRKSSTGTAASPATTWGYQTSDTTVQGDYDADGKTDIAVWRPSNGTWYIIKSATVTYRIQQWGQSGDIPVPAPYRR